jgi:PAS domain S-box-containing protein
MQQIMDFFGIKDLIPHGYCLSWSPALLWLNVISDLLITLAYYSIPLTIIYFLRQRKDWPYPWLMVMFSGFIVACGTTHLLSAITIWIPLYWLDAVLKGFTALLSLITAILMLWVAPQALSLPSVKQLQNEMQQRKVAEDALMESEFRWKFAIHGSGDGVWDRNLQTGVVEYSSCWKAMLGYAENEILPSQQAWLNLIHPDDKAYVVGALQAYLDGNAANYIVEYRLRCKDESYKWILCRGVVVSCSEDGKPLRMIGTHTDITERKQTEMALHHSQAELQEKERMLSESQRIAHIGSWSLDLATGYLKWSEEMYAIFGVTPETFGHTLDEIDLLIFPEDQHLKNSWFSECLKGNEMEELVFRIRLPDGIIRFLCTQGELRYDVMSEPLRLVGSTQDISDRKYKESLDREHLSQLAHVTRLGLMGEMASGIAHEVNQPLTAISTYAQVSLNLIKKENPDLIKLAEVAVKTQEQALRAGQIIHHMKQFCKSKSQQRSTTDINELINDCVKLCADPLKQNSIKLTLELEDNLPLIHIDHIQIEQVLINLIRNGIDAILSAPANKQGHIGIQSHLTANNEIRVNVKDNGPGIQEDQLPKILTPFHTTKADGMGMGLSISLSLIEAHQGVLRFKSKLGEGSTFYFMLPTAIEKS